MEHVQRHAYIGRGNIIGKSPQLLGCGAHHDISNLRNSCAQIRVLSFQAAYERLVSVGIVCGGVVERRIANALHVLHLACQRAQNDELVAINNILVLRLLGLPFQQHRAGINQTVLLESQ